jgi:hypothetical protein
VCVIEPTYAAGGWFRVRRSEIYRLKVSNEEWEECAWNCFEAMWSVAGLNVIKS